MHNAGARIDLIDFTDSNESFVTCSSTGEIALWCLKYKRFTESIVKLAAIDVPLSKMRVIREDMMIIAYNRLHRKFLIISRSTQPGIEAAVTKLCPSQITGNFYGECTDFQIDNTQRFLIASFASSNRLAVIDIDKQLVLLQICEPHISVDKVWIDETGFFLATLTQDKSAVEVYMLDWEYKINEPQKPQKQEISLDEQQK